jgi:hypothetical protein
MIEYILGIFLCWLAWFTGDKVKRRTASKIPGSTRTIAFIWITGNVALLIGVVGFFYGFLIFSWWLPLIAIALLPISGFVYVILEGLLSIAVLSVPICGLAGVSLLWRALL